MYSCLFNPQIDQRKDWFLMLLICLVGSALCMGIMWGQSKMENPFYADSDQYIKGAYNLYHHQTFSERINDIEVKPSLGREPGWSFAIAVFGHIDPAFQSLTSKCLSAKNCKKEQASGIQWLNRVLFASAGIFVFFTGYLITGRVLGASIAGGAIWLNRIAQKNMEQVVSDPLALFLVALFVFMLALGIKYKSIWFWAGAALSLACLALTKGVFYYFGLLFILGWLGLGLYKTIKERSLKPCNPLKLLVFAVVFLIPILSWMDRNHQISGEYRLSNSRVGVVLSAREIYNHMTLAQYFTSFVYWTRTIGDNLTYAVIDKEVWADFESNNPDGFFLKSHSRYGPEVSAKSTELNISRKEAEKIIDKHYMTAIFSNPLTHAVVTLPLFYRGLWIDEFFMLSLPALIWIVFLCWKHNEARIVVILSSSLFNLIFYALVSLNVPRYQMTALPGFALAIALSFVILAERGVFDKWKKRLRLTNKKAALKE